MTSYQSHACAVCKILAGYAASNYSREGDWAVKGVHGCDGLRMELVCDLPRANATRCGGQKTTLQTSLPQRLCGQELRIHKMLPHLQARGGHIASYSYTRYQ